MLLEMKPKNPLKRKERGETMLSEMSFRFGLMDPAEMRMRMRMTPPAAPPDVCLTL